MGVDIYYDLCASFKTETWSGCVFLFCLSFFFLFIFVMLADGHWTNLALKFLSYLFGGLCSVVLGKPLSVFSGSCLHNPVHTPILSLY